MRYDLLMKQNKLGQGFIFMYTETGDTAYYHNLYLCHKFNTKYDIFFTDYNDYTI